MQQQQQQRCKVVVRHLPPSLDEQAFRAAIAEWLERADYFYYVQGKQRCGRRGGGREGRAGLHPAQLLFQSVAESLTQHARDLAAAAAAEAAAGCGGAARSLKELVHSRAYLRFPDPSDVFRFTQHLDGHAFLTERGAQFR